MVESIDSNNSNGDGDDEAFKETESAVLFCFKPIDYP